jgi:protocatechuate 3,4-dioxygenase, beta subunit
MSVQRERRRLILAGAGLVATYFTTRGAFAEALSRTPRQTAGPFYPDRLPLDTDNDLVIINDGVTPAVGAITWLSGRILDTSGAPVRDAMVEIWQVDNNGAYLHRSSSNAGRRDGNFQGFGRFLTGSTGEYLFRTIKPVPYDSRTPHVHFSVQRRGAEAFTTQCYVAGEPRNDRDFILSALDARSRSALIVPFQPIPGSRTGELTARFDIVLA